jgi:DNA-cytosine methyltransferase
LLSSKKTDRTTRIVQALNRFMGLSQEAIAKELGVSFTTVNAWCTGKRAPRPSAAKSLEGLLDRLTSSQGDLEHLTRSTVAKLHAELGSPRLGNRKDPLDELFFILLGLKTSHRTYEGIYERFRERFYPWSRLLRTEPETIEEHIREGGLGSIKANAFVEIAKRLKGDFGSVSLSKLKRMPAAEAGAYLESLPGVGLKTARCVLLYALGHDVTPVDTHTYRVGVRLGLVPTGKDTKHIHAAFDAIVPPTLAYALHTNFVELGRTVCLDPTPRCEECPIERLCGFRTERTESKRAFAAEAPAPKTASRLASEPPLAVDLYAGCGGLSAGLRDAGFHVGYALDWDEPACETHRLNFPESIVDRKDVREIRGEQVLRILGGRPDLVAGGPNCQGVSERGLRNPDDPRNFMFPEYARLVEELRPPFFLMENVPGLAHRHNYGILKTIFETFKRLGYRCEADVLLAAHYGVPQLRYRFFLIGTLTDAPLSLPVPTHVPASAQGLFSKPFVTTWDAIGDLPVITVDSPDDGPLQYVTPAPANEFQAYARQGSSTVFNHSCSDTQKVNLDRAKHIPEGGNWKDIPRELLPDRFFTCRMTDHSTTYARLRRDMPAYTITALFGNITAGAFTHPLTNRPLSVREGARLQSFRDTFVFRGARNSQYRQIGNAVPPLLARAVGAHLRALMRGERVGGLRPRITEAVLADDAAWDALPILTPRFKELFGTGTRWPIGWGPKPRDYSSLLDQNYSLRPEFWPPHLASKRKRPR